MRESRDGHRDGESSATAGTPDPPDEHAVARRRFLAAGLGGAPLVLTVKARSVWAKTRRPDGGTEADETDSAALSGDHSEAPEA